MIRSVAPALLLLASASVAGGSPPAAAGQNSRSRVQTPAEAIAQDAAQYARRHSVTEAQAAARLRAQHESVAVTDKIRSDYAGRLAGIAFDHSPEFRIVVLLTGLEPVASQEIVAGGIEVPIVFRTGAAATREQIVAAMLIHRSALRSAVPAGRGMGLDQRTGELVIFVGAAATEPRIRERLEQEARNLTGVPVRVQLADSADSDMALAGGSRIEGTNAGGSTRNVCTAGFLVTEGARTGLVTAAHCPDQVTYEDREGSRVALEFLGQWGMGHQDVQLHAGVPAGPPLFYADRKNGSLRALTSWRNRTSTRAGESVCHWGESSGYSCAEVQLTDYAPPGDLCAGPCRPMWVTVAGPGCRTGDSGGPIFSGTTAFGILKGGSGIRGRCRFYYYMSTDYLPTGWSLLHE